MRFWELSQIKQMNEELFYLFYNFGSLHALSEVTFFLAEYFGYFVSIAVFLWIIWKFRMFFIKKAAIAFGISVFAWIVAHIFKAYFSIPRPFQILDDVTPLVFGTHALQALPSGHATFFGALATSIYFLDKRAGVAVWVCAFIIGLARIMAGVHWPSDILVGWVLGTLIAMILNEEWLYKASKKLKIKS